MKGSTLRTLPVLVVASALVLAGCSGSDEPDPGPTSASPTSGETQGTEGTEGTVTAEATYLGVPVRVEIAPVQVADGVALLSVDYSLADDAEDGATVAIGQILQPATGPSGVGAVRLLDPASVTVLLPGTDASKQPATTRDALVLTADAPVHSDAFYAAPDSETVDVLFPYLGLVTDVPVEDAEDGTLAVTPEDLGREGEITYATAPVDAFTQTLDDSSSARVSGDEATVTLSADVLFATDQFALTPEAQGVVDAAAQEIAAAGQAGEVRVVGHTDDVGTDEYNQDLSVKRATAVAERLAPQLAGFTLATEGRGESEPAVAGTTPEARAANRRVEVTFTVTTPGAAVAVGDGTGAPLPPATGPESTGTGTVDVELRGDTLRIGATVRRHAGYLVGSLEVERTSAGTGQLTELFGTPTQGLDAGRGLSYTSLLAGAHNTTLLAAGTRFYPGDYLRPGVTSGGDLRATLTDQFLSAQLAQGQSVTVTVVWPDPGGDTVTIDVPDRFRLTDVRVTD